MIVVIFVKMYVDVQILWYLQFLKKTPLSITPITLQLQKFQLLSQLVLYNNCRYIVSSLVLNLSIIEEVRILWDFEFFDKLT